MKATELRIGNWVDIKDLKHAPKTWQVEGVGNLIHVGGQLWSIEELEPIPLTEEWLERFGAKFELVENYRRYFVLDYNVWQHYHISKAMPNMKENLLWSFTVNNNDGKSYELYSITYVHQLQNLYFALTGKELELK